MIIDIIKKADRQSRSLITDIDMDYVYGLYLQYYLENNDVEVLDSKELEKEIKKLGFDVQKDKIIRNKQFNEILRENK